MSIGLGSSLGLGWEFCWEWTWKCARTGVESIPAVGWEAHRDQAWKGAWIELKRVWLGSMLGPGWEVYQDQDQCVLALGGKFTGTRQGSVCCLPGCGAGLGRRITVLKSGDRDGWSWLAVGSIEHPLLPSLHSSLPRSPRQRKQTHRVSWPRRARRCSGKK